jgi:uncharacterized membrane protein YphA (DoxX/SURF4 family)
VLHGLSRVPLRGVTGAFILNSGLQKFRADEEHAKRLHGFAAGAFPVFQSVDAVQFARVLAVSEIALGAALLLPVVPNRVAGAALTAFSGGLLGLYWRTPGMHEPGDPRPTADGTALAKDVWMLGIGLALLIES